MPEWIPFDGYDKDVPGYPDLIELHPHIDAAIRITLHREDVRFGSLFVRVGAIIKNVDIPEGSVVNSQAFTQSPNTSTCGGPTMCLGGVEFCCRDGRAVDACTGFWRCL